VDLFNDFVEALDLPDLNLCVVLRIVALDRWGVGTILPSTIKEVWMENDRERSAKTTAH
jgi:hypothetical protein